MKVAPDRLKAVTIAILRGLKALVQAIMEDPKTENRHQYGTPAILMVANELGLLPTKNFSSGQFEGAEAISGERVADFLAERGGQGRSGTACLRGCLIQWGSAFSPGLPL